MAGELLREEKDSEHRYHITRTEKGHLVTMRSHRKDTPWMPVEWLHKTPEVANACLDALTTLTEVWRAIVAGQPAGDLLRTAEARSVLYTQVRDSLDDQPLMGHEVQAMRGQEDS